MQIFVTGMGLVTPAGSGINPLWEKCLEKKPITTEGLGAISNESLESLWGDIANSSWIKKSPEYLSKSLILALHSIISAVEEAKWDGFTKKDLIVIGTTTGQISRWEKDILKLLKYEGSEASDKNKLRAQPLQTLTESLRSTLDFPGLILVLASACSASTQAIIAGHDYLQSNRAERAIVGGVEELSELTITGFGSLKLLSQFPCKPFDGSRVGINLSEGAGFYTLEKNARNGISRLFAGDTVLDSFHMTSPSAEGVGLQRAIESSLAKNHLNSSDISMIHAHGTGSIHNDQSEAYAIKKIFSHDPPVISTKGVHGHALGASGAIELGLCLQMLKTQTVLPITGLNQVDPQILVNVSSESHKKEMKYLLKTTLGFGGVNSSFILGGPHA